jgi:hypothetical protein
VTPATISSERALEIIAAHGADSRRWPADEREAALLRSIADPAVAAALVEARQLDALLGAWAVDVAPLAPCDAATLIPVPAVRQTFGQRPFSQRQRWWTGGAVAAAITGLLLMPALQAPSPLAPRTEIATNMISDVPPAPSAAGESEALADEEAFATVFTPTADEDQLI